MTARMSAYTEEKASITLDICILKIYASMVESGLRVKGFATTREHIQRRRRSGPPNQTPDMVAPGLRSAWLTPGNAALLA